MSDEVDVGSPAARALREIQMLDELSGVGGPTRSADRDHIIRAEDALGELLGLACTGVREDDVPHYAHGGDTCPIHEWLVPDDQRVVTR